MERRDKVNYYLDLAEVVAQRGTCLRRLYGAVIVKNDEVISTGYVGAPRGRKNCSDIGFCIREKLQIPRGQRHHQRAAARDDRQLALPDGHRGRERGICAKLLQLLHVQAHGHQRRHKDGLYPGYQG